MLAGTAAVAGSLGLRLAWAEDGVVEIVAAPASLKLAGPQGPESALIGFDGRVPGPVLRLRQGELARFRFRNLLDEQATIHWHGIRLENAMDGVPGLTQQAVPPGGSFDYQFVPPDAGTFWYHAHVDSWSQVSRGLFGGLIVEEADTAFGPLHDHLLVLADWRLNDQGLFDAASLGNAMDWSHAGRIGTVLTANSAITPDLAMAADQAHRLRLVNAATARVLKLTLAGAQVIARDGQNLANPFPMPPKFVLGPAQRVDLMVVPLPGQVLELAEVSGDPLVIAVLSALPSAAGTTPPRLMPAQLPEPDLANAVLVPLLMQGGALGRLKGVEVAEMHAMGDMAATGPIWAFNNVSGMVAEPLATVGLGATILLEMVNDTAWDHAIHVHGHHFRVLTRQGQATGDDAWLDTVMIAPGESLKVAFVADNPGDWMIHCHMLEHSASGMDTWFRVSQAPLTAK